MEWMSEPFHVGLGPQSLYLDIICSLAVTQEISLFVDPLIPTMDRPFLVRLLQTPKPPIVAEESPDRLS
jgi:hypothetical protein